MIKDRLLRFIAMENISSTQFADAIGVQRSTVSHLLSGRNNPSYDFIVKTLNHYKYLSADWLICGSGPMYRQKDGSTNDIFSQAVATERKEEQPVNQELQPAVEAPAPTDPSQKPADATLNNNSTANDSNDLESNDNPSQNVLEALAGMAPNAQPAGNGPQNACQERPNNARQKDIQRIVIFYTDHSMDIYEQ